MITSMKKSSRRRLRAETMRIQTIRDAQTSGKARKAMASPKSVASIRQTSRQRSRRQARLESKTFLSRKLGLFSNSPATRTTYLKWTAALRWNLPRLLQSRRRIAQRTDAFQLIPHRKTTGITSCQPQVSPILNSAMSPCRTLVSPASRVCNAKIVTTTSETSQAIR